MNEFKMSFSTELYGYDNDALPGIVEQNSAMIFQKLISDGTFNAPEEIEASMAYLGRRLEQNKSVFTNFTSSVEDTGEVLPTTKHESFAEPEEKEYKVQIVTFTILNEMEQEEMIEILDAIEAALKTSLDRDDKEKDPTMRKALQYHDNVDLRIINSLQETLEVNGVKRSDLDIDM